ncbi:cardiolipin synthase [Iodidimonas muriae]|uniref:Phospholipase D n=1 Tax=Iodidimonas muriae TaxID=261467 RepID=A0ABQ2LBC6_9PROT|nr:phospholipase D-like domain-containing protein [Iodidimonas muriae]GER08026.1 cardiolipin synthase [Kordiimonadales bacterium JCM 17843]GGO09111.1 cardiolipin synthase [Iodidimonas muriae]
MEPISSFLLGLALFAASVLASMHILLTKRDVRAAIGWVAIIWLLPGAGAVGYLILGVNRVQRRAERQLREKLGALRHAKGQPEHHGLLALDPTAAPRFLAHSRLGHGLTGLPLCGGNHLKMLINGDEAYPAMLEAINTAQRSVAFCTYIYDWDSVGQAFARALKAALDRGVKVCVLVDAMGSPLIAGRLRKMGIDARAFNRPSLSHLTFINLRTHRKLLLVDGSTGFTGGMNIRDIHRASGERGLQSQDVMFRVDGPVLSQLFTVFDEDWRFAGGAPLHGPSWDIQKHFDDGDTDGPAVARTVPDGPEEEFSNAGWIIESALSIARRRVRVSTPYFLPDIHLLSALSQAALRGVEVDILVPERNNYRVMGWASEALFEGLLKRGVRLHLTPPPLDHMKMMVVDDYWAMIGSTNWDARSFRLNFELNLEIFDAATARSLDGFLEERQKKARTITWSEVRKRPLPIHLRNRAAWLMSPYL